MTADEIIDRAAKILGDEPSPLMRSVLGGLIDDELKDHARLSEFEAAVLARVDAERALARTHEGMDWQTVQDRAHEARRAERHAIEDARLAHERKAAP